MEKDYSCSDVEELFIRNTLIDFLKHEHDFNRLFSFYYLRFLDSDFDVDKGSCINNILNTRLDSNTWYFYNIYDSYEFYELNQYSYIVDKLFDNLKKYHGDYWYKYLLTRSKEFCSHYSKNCKLTAYLAKVMYNFNPNYIKTRIEVLNETC